jgi:hypothetical protein
MFERCLISFAIIAVACAAWGGLPRDATRADRVRPTSVYAGRLRDRAMVPELDRAYAELELAMRPHGCARCHAPGDPPTDRAARAAHASALLESRRAIVPMLEANLMPPATLDRPAGIADPAERAVLIRRARAFWLAAEAAIGPD